MINIKSATTTDLPRIVEVHESAFPEFFLTQMGRRFLQAYYRQIFDYPRGIILTAHTTGKIAGFVAGFKTPHDFYAYLSANWQLLFLPALTGILHRPGLIGRFIHNQRSLDSRGDLDPESCELSSIGVDPDFGGQGIGGELLSAFLNEAGEVGAKQVRLTTDAEQNDPVNRFYVRNGFRLVRRFMSGSDRPMNEYIFEIK